MNLAASPEPRLQTAGNVRRRLRWLLEWVAALQLQETFLPETQQVGNPISRKANSSP
jgi:hypothetical protein